MILSTSRKKYFQSHINTKEFDKQQKLILRFMKASKFTEECIDNFKPNTSLCCIAVAPITKKILLFHHFTEIGVSIANPSKKWVTLKGSGPPTLAIQFELIFFENSEDVTSPSWKKSQEFLSPIGCQLNIYGVKKAE